MAQRHATFYADTVTPLTFCGKSIGWEVKGKGMYEVPYEIQPTKGEHSLESCENCANELHKQIRLLTEHFEGKLKEPAFPRCCDYHANLETLKEFNRADFIGVPEMVAKKMFYTDHHIDNNHNSENWYKLITDYIEYTVDSFGQMPSGYGEPLYLRNYIKQVVNCITNNPNIAQSTKATLLEFVDTIRAPTEGSQTDFNILLSTYQKWLKEFPFDLNSYFADLKPKFEKQIPLFKGKPDKNIYSGKVKTKLCTKGELIELLINNTNTLLTQINGLTLYNTGLLTDADKIQIELIVSNRKSQLEQGYKNNSKDEEQRYRRIIKQWFKDEINFINEIKPFLKTLPKKEVDTKAELEVIAKSENNFWKGLPMSVVVNHFQVMTQKKSKNGKPFLSEEQLVVFLKRGFLNDNDQPIQKVNCSNGEKGKVILRFYQFFELASVQYGYPNKKETFINLFLNCFDNWNENSVKAYFKPNKTKEKW